MSFNNAPASQPSPYIHRMVVNDEKLLEAELAANFEAGYEPISHSAYWDPEHGQRVVSVRYRRVK